jgi:precorrin-6A/cobalt-precorrin-6A reductase
MRMAKLLILGGTTEATALASALAADTRFETLLSFAGATRTPRPPKVPYRVGGFGGVAGLAGFLRDGGFDLLIDATHPFAARMKPNAVAAAEQANVGFLAIQRPAWQAGPGDVWTPVADMAAAARALGDRPRRVLLTIGQKELAAFRAAPWHSFVVRSVDPPDVDNRPPDAVVISARGPFVLEDEMALLREHRIEVLVTKNAGGRATEAKLAAARMLGVDVVMVERPAVPTGVAVAEDIEGALSWLAVHAGTERGV